MKDNIGFYWRLFAEHFLPNDKQSSKNIGNCLVKTLDLNFSKVNCTLYNHIFAKLRCQGNTKQIIPF